MKRIIILIALLFSTVAQAGSLESELQSVIKQAEDCLAKKDCEQFVLDNPLMKIMAEPEYVKKLAYDCLPGSECYSLSFVASDVTIKASMQVLENL
jgi:hypothetical protein